MYRPSNPPKTSQPSDAVGLEPPIMSRLGPDLPPMNTPSSTAPSAAEITSASAQNQELRAELAALRADRDRLLDTQRRIMELLSTTNPDRIVHDLRNLLNERDLFRTLAETAP